jgi:hypothetical protein
MGFFVENRNEIKKGAPQYFVKIFVKVLLKMKINTVLQF